jgi:hypothetical protein
LLKKAKLKNSLKEVEKNNSNDANELKSQVDDLEERIKKEQ